MYFGTVILSITKAFKVVLEQHKTRGSFICWRVELISHLHLMMIQITTQGQQDDLISNFPVVFNYSDG